MINIIVKDSYGTYVEVFDGTPEINNLIDTSEQIGSNIDPDSDTLLNDLRRFYPDSKIIDIR